MNIVIFNRAVEQIRRGETNLEIENALEGESVGIDTLELRTIIAKAHEYVNDAQTQAFDAAVEAFRNGETHFEVSKKLVKCGFHPYDADVVAGRAKAKVDAVQEQK